MGDERPSRQAALPGVDAAHAYVVDRALCPAPVGPVGLELEGHLVDRRDLLRRPSWDEVSRLVSQIGDLPHASAISVEPGGQLELSTKPAPDLSGAVAALRDDERVLQRLLRDQRYGLAFLGLDPVRPGELMNPAPRYAAMTRYFDRNRCGPAGRLIMTSSAGLQLNLEAGLRDRWKQRLGRISRLGPLLGAMSACSPMAAGDSSGWSSMRQEGWAAIDPARTAPVGFDADPAAAWAHYALSAPVMMIRLESEPTDGSAATKHAPGGIAEPPPGLSFADWVRTPDRVGRPPTSTDLDYHLTTLFPPIRPRGYLELRFLDAVADVAVARAGCHRRHALRSSDRIRSGCRADRTSCTLVAARRRDRAGRPGAAPGRRGLRRHRRRPLSERPSRRRHRLRPAAVGQSNAR